MTSYLTLIETVLFLSHSELGKNCSNVAETVGNTKLESLGYRVNVACNKHRLTC